MAKVATTDPMNKPHIMAGINSIGEGKPQDPKDKPKDKGESEKEK